MSSVERNQYVRAHDTESVTIANGQSLSAAINCIGLRLCALMMPTTISGTLVTFQASLDGVTYRDVYDAAGNEYQLVVAAARYIPLDPLALMDAKFIKIRMGTSATPSVQAQDSALQLSFSKV